MGKTEGIFLNLQCDCHRVASMFIKLINLYTNFSTLLPNVTARFIISCSNLICHGASGPKWAKLKEYFSIYNSASMINGVSLNSLAHTFFYRTHRPNK